VERLGGLLHLVENGLAKPLPHLKTEAHELLYDNLFIPRCKYPNYYIVTERFCAFGDISYYSSIY
jgi:hypothetical protein